MKDTIRLIMFLECNLSCSYCCNEKEKFNSLFDEKDFEEINFDEYETICVTGGEPFLKKDVLYKVLDRIPRNKSVYLYTNGMLITDQDIVLLKEYENLKGINVGIHGVGQVRMINPKIDQHFSVRYQAEDKNREKLLSMYPERITAENSRFWRMDDCYRDNEDWVLLRDVSTL